MDCSNVNVRVIGVDCSNVNVRVIGGTCIMYNSVNRIVYSLLHA